eukprot:scpid49735/ scgid18499/ ATP-dependent RNA helicase DDX19A; DDX19-like protein; DEAD box protein 19A
MQLLNPLTPQRWVIRGLFLLLLLLVKLMVLVSCRVFFTSGPLSQPFTSGFDDWDLAASEQEHGYTQASSQPAAQQSTSPVKPAPVAAAQSARPTAQPNPVQAPVPQPVQPAAGSNTTAQANTSHSVMPAAPSAAAVTQPNTADPVPAMTAAKQADATSGTDAAEDAPTTAETSLLNKLLREKLVDNTQSIEVQRSNPDSPLYSVKTFEELRLSKEIMQGVYGMGFNRPSKIQETALPLLLADPPPNLIAQSQSGTGKTAAFVLAVVSRMDKSKKHPQALILAPTLELAKQIGDVCQRMTKFCPEIAVTFAVRGERPSGPVTGQVLIGTPGTVLDWSKRRYVDLKKIRVFVLDEADVMIAQQGHQDQSVHIRKGLDLASTQFMLFSATYDDDVMGFAQRIVSDPIVIKLKRQEESLDNIRQVYIECRNELEKYEALSNIYGLVSIGQAIIFCPSRKSAAWLAEKMHGDGHAVAMLTGELETAQRIAILNRFRQGKEKLLITTNVCARGIDIDQVTVVVNYDIPYDVVRQKPDVETYLHRIGRTGRFGKSGLAINFVDGSRSMRNMRFIEEHFGKKIEKIDKTDNDQISSLGQGD